MTELTLAQVRELKQAAVRARPLYVTGLAGEDAKMAEAAWSTYYDRLYALETSAMARETSKQG